MNHTAQTVVQRTCQQSSHSPTPEKDFAIDKVHSISRRKNSKKGEYALILRGGAVFVENFSVPSRPNKGRGRFDWWMSRFTVIWRGSLLYVGGEGVWGGWAVDSFSWNVCVRRRSKWNEGEEALLIEFPLQIERT